MSKTSERLETYQTQMSIYAEQHKMILASDVLDMIEQLQDDLKDDIEKVVAELVQFGLNSMDKQIYDSDTYYDGVSVAIRKACNIVKRGGVE